MPSHTMSHIIFTSALIALIFLMQFSFTAVVDNMKTEMIKRELKEITDYVSDTLANLYFLVNSTNYSNVTLEKTLNLPSHVQNSIFVINITLNEGSAQSIYAYIKDNSRIDVSSWILPGLKVGSQSQTIESGRETVVAGCSRVSTSALVWIVYK
ncbi:MAG: hypothetical protein JSV12_09325 [Candidatus Bathyarchaeota archaeon]|nr:MAG: hypothetical protein JSV12_09325 [Candidatus Bathyarchaeota archaeon]